MFPALARYGPHTTSIANGVGILEIGPGVWEITEGPISPPPNRMCDLPDPNGARPRVNLSGSHCMSLLHYYCIIPLYCTNSKNNISWDHRHTKYSMHPEFSTGMACLTLVGGNYTIPVSLSFNFDWQDTAYPDGSVRLTSRCHWVCAGYWDQLTLRWLGQVSRSARLISRRGSSIALMNWDGVIRLRRALYRNERSR